MKERVTRLLSVKSIVTIILTAVFAYMSVVGEVGSDQFITIFTVVISFYFGTQASKPVTTTIGQTTDVKE